MSDLKDLYTVDAHEEGAELEIKDPRTGEPHGLVLTLVGSDSDTYRQAQADLVKRRMDNKKEELSALELRDEAVEMLVSCTKGWAGVDDDFNKAAVRELYRKSPPVYDQADAFIHKRDNFYRD